MGLKDIGNSLPLGFRFYPSDEELVCHYLIKKIGNEEVHRGTLVEIDLHTCEPWQLPDVAKLNSNEWYFFSFRDRKYATGFRSNRATDSGYWKATGKDRTIHDPRSGALVGMRKTLVFYKNRAPNGIKTGWIMHEFRVENPNVPPKEDWVLCRVFHKSISGENSNKITSINEMNNIYDCTPNLATLLTIEQSFMPPITSHGSSSLDPGYGLQLPYLDHEPNNLSISSYNQNRMVDHINCDNEYGFLLDMKFDDSTATPSAIGDIKFGDGDGSVFM